MTDPVLLVIYALAFMRVIGLITADTITESIRDRVLEWLDDAPGSIGQWLSYLITCPWCASVWVGAVAAPLIYLHGDNPWMIGFALWFALSQAAGMWHNQGRE